jgi:hypothetical protein
VTQCGIETSNVTVAGCACQRIARKYVKNW